MLHDCRNSPVCHSEGTYFRDDYDRLNFLNTLQHVNKRLIPYE